MTRTSMLGNLAHHHSEMLFTMLSTHSAIALHGDHPVVRTSARLMADEIIAELGHRNDAVIAHREAGAKAMVDAANKILTTRTT